MATLTPAEVQRRATGRVSEVAKTMGAQLTQLSAALNDEIAAAVPELRGDEIILELLGASTQSNVETFLHVVQLNMAIEDVGPPSAAIEYARRLAQRGISTNALLRAYRIGQNRVLAWLVAEIAREEPDREVSFAAAQMMQATTFAYVDKVAELVVAEYETERERWLANRNTVRAAMLASVLDGHDVDLGTAESALGYRLRQHHLGAVLWGSGREGTSELRRLESLTAEIGEAVGAIGQPLFLPQDHNLAWAWIPLGRAASGHDVDAEGVRKLVVDAGPGVRVAVGRPAAAVGGFRGSHEEALRAYSVASLAGQRALPVTSFAEPGVQVSSVLVRDLDFARRLVSSALGDLAQADEGTERLRETLLAFFGAGSSYVAAADQVHLHRNTVRYRVERAVEVRGRSIDEDRLNLELALTACRWLGPAVLPASGRQAQARA